MGGGNWLVLGGDCIGGFFLLLRKFLNSRCEGFLLLRRFFEFKI